MNKKIKDLSYGSIDSMIAREYKIKCLLESNEINKDKINNLNFYAGEYENFNNKLVLYLKTLQIISNSKDKFSDDYIKNSNTLSLITESILDSPLDTHVNVWTYDYFDSMKLMPFNIESENESYSKTSFIEFVNEFGYDMIPYQALVLADIIEEDEDYYSHEDTFPHQGPFVLDVDISDEQFSELYYSCGDYGVERVCISSPELDYYFDKFSPKSKESSELLDQIRYICLYLFQQSIKFSKFNIYKNYHSSAKNKYYIEFGMTSVYDEPTGISTPLLEELLFRISKYKDTLNISKAN